ncbi:ATP-binding cassette sub-family C member 4-like [Leptopilina boulardi]|uniref:ATP-binding cassette sub-family C member 4-like n=1 Tax=Leptopilina boulardi TaxID=63433 RepID=UPI0021F69C0F|nr:ATP-binding cassette sub-family C member 4-like [Leptopilina boulardi]
MNKNEKREARNPREGANPLSILSFAWLWKTFKIGCKRELEQTDLFSPLDSHASQIIGDKLEKQWQYDSNKCKKGKKKTKPKLWKSLAKCFGTNIIVVGIVQFILEFILTIPQPIILGKILQYFNGTGTVTKTEAYYWAGLFTFLFALRSPFFHLSVHSMLHLGMKIRVSCCSLIYRKVLRTSKSAEACSSAGQIVNLLTNDVNSLDYALPFFHYIWMSPIMLIIIAYIIFIQIELPALTGIALYVLIIPLQGLLGKFVPKLAMQSAYRTDKRLRLMNEIIGGVQVIKMYAWEKPFSHLVDKARLKEVSAIRKNYFIDAFAMAFESYAPRLCVYVTILTYALLGNAIVAEKVFMIAAFYNEMRYSMSIAFPLGIQRLAKALASIKRIEEFMELEEIQQSLLDDLANSNNGYLANNKDIVLTLDANNLTMDNNKIDDKKNENFPITNGMTLVNNNSQIVVNLQNASAKWEQSSTELNLKSINFTAKRGALTAVVGQVGSGKTSLFHAILKELPLTSGNLHVQGKVVYVSQEPWIFASSIRQNILFGSPMDKKRYDKVIRVCQLETDFMMFPHKDQTIIGEKGINLSGGQRARINLARAVYSEADVYLLDDPLSAVDTHVGRSLFEKCICKYLKGKTRILVTHQLQFINSADNVYILNNGSVQISGTFQELKKSELDFLSVLQATEEEEKEKDDNKEMSIINDTIAEDITSEEEREEIAEHRTFGKISHKVYGAYFKAVGNYWIVALVFGILILCQIMLSGSDFLLSKWVDAETQEMKVNTTILPLPTSERNFYIYIYSGLIGGAVIIVYLKSLLYFDMCLRSSRNLHSNMFYNILRATMSFFHTNPSGRIMNRFSKDIGQVDKYLPFSLNDVLEIAAFLIAVLTMTFSINYWLIIPTVCIAIIFYFLKAIYIKTSRSVKRLEGITRSPVFSHLSATLNGLTTIRAFRAQQLLTKEFDNHQDVHSASWYLFFSCSRAFGYYLELICNMYVALVIYSFLVLSDGDTVGKVGLIITQTTMLAGMLQWGIVQTAELENQMTAVERIMEYTKIPKEPSLESSDENKPPSIWPDMGRVEFRNVCLSYTHGGDLVLKHLSFVVKPTEKIGIVGRTGAGKSSLINALFRLSYMEGEIYIDGIGISKLGLHDLRSKISIIPQEPLLFAGTLRENLDPFEEYTDDEIWDSLDEVELKQAVVDSGLYGKVSDGGANFSIGQRQLLCLARAIVRKNKILVLDEATANVDPQTDGLIQKTIRKRFENCTVFIIAHRLNTVMDCDKFIVMDAGHMVEFDHPYLLLQKEEGYLHEMVQHTGPEMALVLTKMAEASYNTIKLNKS